MAWESDTIIDLARTCFGQATGVDLTVFGYHLAPHIPDRKLVQACESYARLDFNAEEPVLLYDATVFGSGRRGFLLTTKYWHFNLTSPIDGYSPTTGQVPLATIREFRFVGESLYINGERVGSTAAQAERAVLALEQFFAMLRGDAAPASAPGSAPPDVFETIRKLKELADVGALTPEEFTAKKQELLARL